MLDGKSDTFLQVVRLKSYTLAAEYLHLTQPAVTQHIKKLEAHYGCKLIDSSGHSVRLTEAGRMLYEALCLQKANEEQLKKRLLRESRQLRVGATLSIADYYLPQILAQRVMEAPGQFNVFVGNTESLLKKLSSGQLDCAFVEGLFDRSLFEGQVFCYADFVPFAAADHPLAGKKVEPSALHDYLLVLREEGSGTREVLQTCLLERGDSISMFYDQAALGSFVLMKELVKRSQAVSFAYQAVIQRELREKELCILGAEAYQFVHPLHFVYRKGSLRRDEYRQFFHQILDN